MDSYFDCVPFNISRDSRGPVHFLLRHHNVFNYPMKFSNSCCWLCIHIWIKWELGKIFDTKMIGWSHFSTYLTLANWEKSLQHTLECTAVQQNSSWESFLLMILRILRIFPLEALKILPSCESFLLMILRILKMFSLEALEKFSSWESLLFIILRILKLFSLEALEKLSSWESFLFINLFGLDQRNL